MSVDLSVEYFQPAPFLAGNHATVRAGAACIRVCFLGMSSLFYCGTVLLKNLNSSRVNFSHPLINYNTNSMRV